MGLESCQSPELLSAVVPRWGGSSKVRPTVSIIVEVDQLIGPLRDNPQRILEKRYYDQESSNGR